MDDELSLDGEEVIWIWEIGKVIGLLGENEEEVV